MRLRKSDTNTKIQSLIKILRMEQVGQFADDTVVGGMDLFLQRWSSELSEKITIDSSYKEMSLSQRKQWAEKIMNSLGYNFQLTIAGNYLKRDSNLGLTGQDDILKLRCKWF